MSFSPPLKLNKLPLSGDVLYRTGVLYRGRLDDNMRCGLGVLAFPDGSLYEGLFQNNQRNGDGLQVWQDGSKYKGEFSGDLRQGHGQQMFADGSSYIGSFFYDRLHGTGKYSKPDGSTFEGLFYLDKREGYGKLTYADGGVFQGLYKADQREGPGIWTHSDRTQDVGLWHGDKLIKLCTPVAGAFRMKDHPTFEYDRQDHVPSVSFSIRESNRNDIVHDILKPPAPFDYGNSADHAAAVFSHFLDAESLGLDRLTFEREFFKSPNANGILDHGPSAVVTVPAWNMTPSSVTMQRHVLRHGYGSRKAPAVCEQALQAVMSGTRPTGSFGAPGPLEAGSLEMLLAARDGNTAAVRRLLMADTLSVDVTDSSGCTALLLAVMSCHVDVINCLLDNGADINKVTDEGLSPLSVCFVFYYPLETFKKNIAESTYVIASSAPAAADQECAGRADSTSSRQTTPAEREASKSTAASAKHSIVSIPGSTAGDTARKLGVPPVSLLPGGKPEQSESPHTAAASSKVTPSDSADTPDSSASSKGTEVARVSSAARLLESDGGLGAPPVGSGTATAGAPSVVAESHRSAAEAALDEAEEEDDRKSLELIAKASQELRHSSSLQSVEEIDKVTLDDNLTADDRSARVTVEHPVSVSQDMLETSAMLLSKNERAVKSMSAVRHSSELRLEAVRVLAARLAERSKRWETIQLLLRRGANPSVSTAPLPPLIFAVKAADVEAVKLLLTRGADVNVQLPTKAGRLSPLHLAVATPGPEGVEIVEHLLNSLADPDARALPDASYLMQRSGTEDDDEGQVPAAGGRDRQRSAAGASAESAGRTPLHIACSRDDDYQLAARIVGLLLEHNANPDVVCNGHSPLSLAIVSGNDLAVDKLLKHGANPSLMLTHGNGNALCVAAHTAYEQRREPAKRVALVDKLIAAGADILALTPIGSKKVTGTAVDYAYHVFNQDRRIAHMPYHALTHTERETYNARRHLLAHIGDILREKYIEREHKRLEAEQALGLPSRNASARFHYAAVGRPPREISSAPPTRATGVTAAAPSGTTSKVTFGHEEFFGIIPTQSQLAAGVVTIGPFGTKSVRVLESLEEQSKVLVRKPLFKYCYNCGRSVGVRLTACTRCKEVYFCSKPCKLRAWNARHKDECVRIQGSKASSAANGRKVGGPAQELNGKVKAALMEGHRVVTHKGAAMDKSYNLSNRADQRVLVPVKGRSHSMGNLETAGRMAALATSGSAAAGDKAARALRELKVKEKAAAALALAKADLAERLAYEDNYSFE